VETLERHATIYVCILVLLLCTCPHTTTTIYDSSGETHALSLETLEGDPTSLPQERDAKEEEEEGKEEEEEEEAKEVGDTTRRPRGKRGGRKRTLRAARLEGNTTRVAELQLLAGGKKEKNETGGGMGVKFTGSTGVTGFTGFTTSAEALDERDGLVGFEARGANEKAVRVRGERRALKAP
jgi:hypothetical protein